MSPSPAGERRFGPYALVHQIAVGGMAEIHLARARGIAGFEKYVALKMIHPNFSEDQQFVQMLIDEAKITVQLQHVNIAQTFDLGRVDRTYYITMEFVDGADLYKLMRKSAEGERDVPVSVAAYVAKEVATGLDYAHRKRDLTGRPLGIVHRDVSPQNVLISHAGEVKLVDFGIAKASMRARQTQAGVIKGKYYYMSPEQAHGEALDHRTDVFSTGILLYEMLTGQMLYLEEDLHKLLEIVRRADIPPPSTLRRDIPPALERIVMRALEKRPQDRHRSAGELATDLERFIHGQAPVFTATKVSQWMGELLAQPTRIPPVAPVAPEPPSSTGRLPREQLAHARGEFIDEHSVIREGPVLADADLEGTSDGFRSAARPWSLDDAETPRPGKPAPPSATASAPNPGTKRTMPIPALRSGSSPAPEARPAPSGRPPTKTGSMPTFPRSSEDQTRALKDVGGALRAPAKPVELDPNATLAMPPSPETGFADLAEQTLISEPPGFDPAPVRDARVATRIDHAAEPASPPTARVRDPALETRDIPGRPTPTGVAPRGALGPRDVEATTAVRPPAEPLTPVTPPAGPRGVVHRAAHRAAPLHLDDSSVGDETGVNPPEDTAPPSPPRGDAGWSGDETSALITTVKPPPNELETATRPALAWEAAPALAASVPRPAISELRPPRQSRRTPVSGVDPTTPSALASILSPERARVPQIAMAPSIGDGAPTGDGRARPPWAAHGSPDEHVDTATAATALADEPAPFGQPSPGFGQPAPGFAQSPPGSLRPGHDEPLEPPSHTAHIRPPDGHGVRLGRDRWPLGRIGVAAIALAIAVAIATVVVRGGDDRAASAPVPVEIVSSPPGAAVTIDGVAHPERTPTKFAGAAGRRYRVALELPRYQRWEGETSDETKVIAVLRPVAVKLHVRSEPTDAEVFVNGAPVGRTPIDLDGLDGMTRTVVEVRKKGLRPVRQVLEWGERETEKSIDVALSN